MQCNMQERKERQLGAKGMSRVLGRESIAVCSPYEGREEDCAERGSACCEPESDVALCLFICLGFFICGRAARCVAIRRGGQPEVRFNEVDGEKKLRKV